MKCHPSNTLVILVVALMLLFVGCSPPENEPAAIVAIEPAVVTTLAPTSAVVRGRNLYGVAHAVRVRIEELLATYVEDGIALEVALCVVSLIASAEAFAPVPSVHGATGIRQAAGSDLWVHDIRTCRLACNDVLRKGLLLACL